MRYLDTGGRDAAHTLASWLAAQVQGDIAQFRLQSGFFSLDGIGLLLPLLQLCKTHNKLTNILIGSNDSTTLRDDVIGLADAMGIPRGNAQLGVVNFGGAFFHPKTYHFTRADGSQSAFIGSSNLTRSGLSLHVEAGITLDTLENDDPHLLTQIASAIDSWFIERRAGLTSVGDLQTVQDLVDSGVLSIARPPRTAPVGGAPGNPATPARPRLQSLYQLPPVPPPAGPAVPLAPAGPATPAGPAAPAPLVAALPSSPRAGFPQYLLFQPNAVSKTSGAAALTGALLPGGSAGLIVQLNKDSARHFAGGSGTANISIPVATASTLRFGVDGVHNGPTTAFNLHVRFLHNNGFILGATANTSVKGYGFTPTETGHGDIRMVVPASVRSLGHSIAAAGMTAPKADDLAFIEWPTPQDPVFRLSFINTQAVLYQQASALFNAAAANGQLVGKGACWLPTGCSPIW